jgi:hypothetical protein
LHSKKWSVRVAAERKTQRSTYFLHSLWSEVRYALAQALLRNRDCIVKIYGAGSLHTSSSSNLTSDGTPRMAEVTGATVAVDKYRRALSRVSTTTGP